MWLSQFSGFVVRWRATWFALVASLFLASFLLVSCSGFSFGGGSGSGGAGGSGNSSSPSASTTLAQLPLAKLHWCSKPFILFRDEHAPVTSTPVATATTTTSGTPAVTATGTGTGSPTATVSPTTSTGGPTTITDWSQVKPNLGFTVFLPATLPRGSCLVSASGTLHDPIFGGNFIIGYLLPGSNPLSLSEAPVRSNSPQFQCTSAKGDSGSVSEATIREPAIVAAGTPAASATASPTQVPVLLCTGVRDNTNIVFSGRGSETSLKQFFDALQPDIQWVPTS